MPENEQIEYYRNGIHSYTCMHAVHIKSRSLAHHKNILT